MKLRRLLAGENVRLNALTKDDVDRMLDWEEHSDFKRLGSSNPAFPWTRGRTEKWLEELDESSDEYYFAIRAVRDSVLVGVVSIDEIEWTHGTGQLGIGIGESRDWGKGYGREACALALDFAFHELNLHRIGLGVFAYNERAIKLYESLGFVREGVERESIYRDGERYDQYFYGLLRPDWDGA